jgi:hypothetical protein
MPVIPATRETEIRGSWFKASPGKKVSKTLSISINRQGSVAHFCDSNNARGADRIVI